jgi:hypothetical protein
VTRHLLHAALGVLTVALLCPALLKAEEPGKRSSFTIPLARLSVSFDERTHVFEKVKVSPGGSDDNSSDDCWIIAPITDFEIRTSRDGRQKFVHAEAPDKAYIISDFEAMVLNKVCKSFASTLEIFEKDLQKKHWNQCLYLDAYFPHFLKGFYYLYCAARNSPYALPRSACIPDSLFDISLTSTKSDERVKNWQQQTDYVIKLRIITKELMYQIKEWQKKEIDNPSRNVEVQAGKVFEEAFTLFVKLYFNMKPSPEVPKEGEHLER